MPYPPSIAADSEPRRHADWLRSVLVYLIICLAAAALILNPLVTKLLIGLSNGWVLFPLAFDLYAALIIAFATLNLRMNSSVFGAIAISLAILILPAMFIVELAIYYHEFNIKPNPGNPGDNRVEGVHQHYEVLGWSPIPNGVGRHVSRGNFDVRYEFDDKGRKRIVQDEKAVRTVRVFGDSFAFGHGVSNENTSMALLAKKINPEFNVFNNGVMGYGLEQMYLSLERNISEVQSGDIVIFLPTAIDIYRTMINREWSCGRYFASDHITTFPMLNDHGWISVDLENECSYTFDFLLLKSKLIFGRLYEAYIGVTTDGLFIRNADILFELARNAVEGKGARFAVVLVARPNECIAGVHDVDWTRLDTKFTSLMGDCPGEPEQARKYRFPTDGHLSEEGNAWLAESLFGYLREIGEL